MSEKLEVQLTELPGSPGSHWAEPTRYMRDIAKWLIGGIFAAALAIGTGSSLTNIGALDPRADLPRFVTLCAGLGIATLALGRILKVALTVFTFDSASVDEIAEAQEKEPFSNLKAQIEEKFRFSQNEMKWPELLSSNEDIHLKTVEAIEDSMGFFLLREKFLAMQGTIIRWGGLSIIGLVAFAWAANPPKVETGTRQTEIRSWKADTNQMVTTTDTVRLSERPEENSTQ